jgi:hypothetical protein
MQLKFDQSIDNNVREYPLWFLISGSVIMSLLATGHYIRYKQSSNLLHFSFIISLLCSIAQYIYTTQDINTAYLTLIADFIAIDANTALFCDWADSMKKYVKPCHPFLIFCIRLFLGIALLASINMTILAMIDSATSEDHLKTDNLEISCWHITILFSFAIIGGLTLLALLYQGCLGSERFEGKLRKRLQLAGLFLLSSLLLASKFGTVLGIPLLYTIPFLLFHTIPILTRDLMSDYYRKPEDIHHANHSGDTIDNNV